MFQGRAMKVLYRRIIEDANIVILTVSSSLNVLVKFLAQFLVRDSYWLENIQNS